MHCVYTPILQYIEVLVSVIITRLRCSMQMTSLEMMVWHMLGDAVDVLWMGGWWEGYVTVTRDKSVDVYFPGGRDTEEVQEDQSGIPEDERNIVRFETAALCACIQLDRCWSMRPATCICALLTVV